jgi:hypothetical protein
MASLSRNQLAFCQQTFQTFDQAQSGKISVITLGLLLRTMGDVMSEDEFQVTPNAHLVVVIGALWRGALGGGIASCGSVPPQ